MKITVKYNQDKIIKKLAIREVEFIDDFILKIKYDDGYENIIDFKPFLLKSKHPSIQKYLNEQKFKSYTLQNGNLYWNDYELIFPLADLYYGRI